jgi:pimeloyl-ACP methyl ester carboxylesterase
MDPYQPHVLNVNGIRLSVQVAGPEHGRPVWLLHGFPECWYSWRRQVPALVAAGYRVFVPELRGYGASDAPEAVEDYDLLTLCADIQGAMDAFGQRQVAMVGHDWGAMLAWYLALLEPERIQALVTLSVPFAGRPRRPATEIMRELHGERFNYILYFQTPGVAEAEMDADLDASLRLFMGNAGALLQPRPADARLFDGIQVPSGLPAWCSEADFARYRQSFAGRGFRGALNWYRNFERNWQRSEFLAGAQVTQPTLFLIGDQDPVGVLEAHTLKRMPDSVPHLDTRVLADCGHWIQSEQGDEVNRHLLAFLGRTYPPR